MFFDAPNSYASAPSEQYGEEAAELDIPYLCLRCDMVEVERPGKINKLVDTALRYNYCINNKPYNFKARSTNQTIK